MKKIQHKTKMYKHRFWYWVDQNPNVAGFWFCMTGLLVSEVMLYLVK
jgi:hypothetical protein